MRLLSAILAVVLSTLAWPDRAAADAPAFTLKERANAIAAPALIFLDVRLEGVMRVRDTNVIVDTGSLVIRNRCSAFAVNAAGYAITSSHCVHPTGDQLRATAAVMATNKLIRDKKLASTQKDATIRELLNTADFTESTGTAVPEPKISAQQFIATSGGPVIAAEVMGAEPPAAGSVALIKLAQKGLPVVELGSAGPAVGDGITQIGYGTYDSELDQATFLSRMKGSKIVGKTGLMSKMDSELGNFSYGGLVVDSSGRAIGMINSNPDSKDKLNNLATDPEPIKALLDTFGLGSGLQPMDKTYRSALDAYFGGHYAQAISLFDQVITAVPGHQTAQSFRKKAAERLAIEGSPAGPARGWIIAAVAVGGLVLVIAVATLVVVMRRRSRRRKAGTVTADIFAAPRLSLPAPTKPDSPESVELFAWPKEESTEKNE